jgi:hypothetical protein
MNEITTVGLDLAKHVFQVLESRQPRLPSQALELAREQ